jgi:hypothetical protein
VKAFNLYLTLSKILGLKKHPGCPDRGVTPRKGDLFYETEKIVNLLFRWALKLIFFIQSLVVNGFQYIAHIGLEVQERDANNIFLSLRHFIIP